MISGYHHFRKSPYSHKHIMVPTTLLFRSDRLGPGILFFKNGEVHRSSEDHALYNYCTWNPNEPLIFVGKDLVFLTIPQKKIVTVFTRSSSFFPSPPLDPRWVTCSCHLQTSKICSFQSSASPVPQDREPNGFHLPNPTGWEVETTGEFFERGNPELVDSMCR